MKRILLIGVAVVAWAGIAFAGGQKASSSGGPITLKLWAGNSTVTPEASFAPSAEYYTRVFKDFEAKNPDIKIETQVLPGGTEALQQMLAAAAVNNLPDVAIPDGFWLARLKEQNIIKSLAKFWPKSEQADFLKDVITASSFNGEPHAVWFYTAVRGIVYRKDILKQETGLDVLPTNKDEFIAAMKKLAKPGRVPLLVNTNASEGTALHLWPYFWAYGGKFADDTGKPVFHEGASREALRKTYQWYYDMANVHKIIPAEPATGSSLELFYADQAFAFYDTSSTLTTIKNNRPDLYEKIGFQNYPIEKGLRAIPHLVGWTYAITTDDPVRQEAAWRFVSYMTSTEVLKTGCEINGYIPIRQSIVDTSTFFKTDPVISQAVAINFGGPIQARPNVGTYPVIANSIAAQIEPLIAGKITADQAIDNAAATSMEDWQRSRR
jgi:ABC-type glycerol-3-phosphate transport system substrate-binding protein